MGELTSEEMGRLRVALAELPGLDPVGLLLRWYMGTANPDVVAIDCGDYPPASRVLYLVDNTAAAGAHRRSTGRQWLALDLADAATADAVARWVAGRIGLQVGCTAPGWLPLHGGGGWALAKPRALFLTQPAPGCDHPNYIVPALAALDPADDRRLPDGSRFVDRDALAIVARHVAGRLVEVEP